MTTESMLTELLAKKHSKDLFVAQCKTGSTWYQKQGPLHILDVWAMKKSWRNPYTYGYEIKVSRGDFLRDEKWKVYLDYCTDFYFVAPPGVIDPKELPDEAGLLVCTKNVKRLLTKKHAPSRRVNIPDSIFRYILMWRVQEVGAHDIVRDHQGKSYSQEYWEGWLKKKKLDRQFGRMVSRAIGERVETEVHAARRKNEELRGENRNLREIKNWAEKNDIHLWDYNLESRLESLLKQHKRGYPKQLKGQLDRAQKALEELAVALGMKEEEDDER